MHSSASENLTAVRRYYDHTESRLGYSLLLGGTKHFGYYEPGESRWHFRRAMRRMESEIGTRLALAPGAYVLDAGCGFGDVSRALAGRFGLRVAGIDLLDWNIKEARKRSHDADMDRLTTFTEADYHSIPFADSEFNGAVMVETLVHAQRSETVLGELFRVLRPGGHVVLVEYSRAPDSALSPAVRAVMEEIYTQGAMPSWRRFLPGVLSAQLKTAGFENVTEEDITPRILPMLQAFYDAGRLPYFVMRKIGQADKAVNAMSGVETYRHQDAWRYNIYTAEKL